MDWAVFFFVLCVCMGFAVCIIGWAWATDKVAKHAGRNWALLFNLTVVGIVLGAAFGFLSGSQP